jgi:hypothetical protein
MKDEQVHLSYHRHPIPRMSPGPPIRRTFKSRHKTTFSRRMDQNKLRGRPAGRSESSGITGEHLIDRISLLILLSMFFCVAFKRMTRFAFCSLPLWLVFPLKGTIVSAPQTCPTSVGGPSAPQA